MPATFSTEGKLSTVLHELDCSARNFVSIARERGIPISTGPFSQAMTGIRPFDVKLGRRLLEVARLMKTVRDEYQDIPIDWSQHERIALLLTLIVMRQVAQEEGFEQLQRDVEEVIRQEQ